jgi:hypothetical protein
MHVTLLRERTVVGLGDREVVMGDTNVASVRSARTTRTTVGKVIGMSDGLEIYTCLVRRRWPHIVAKATKDHVAQGASIVTLDRPIYRSIRTGKSASSIRHLSEDELLELPTWRELLGYWMNLKRMLAIYKHFGEQNLIGYLKEFEWRHQNRHKRDCGFGNLIAYFPTMRSGTEPVLK